LTPTADALDGHADRNVFDNRSAPNKKEQRIRTMRGPGGPQLVYRVSEISIKKKKNEINEYEEGAKFWYEEYAQSFGVRANIV
jgi:hypothetical protein